METAKPSFLTLKLLCFMRWFWNMYMNETKIINPCFNIFSLSSSYMSPKRTFALRQSNNKRKWIGFQFKIALSAPGYFYCRGCHSNLISVTKLPGFHFYSRGEQTKATEERSNLTSIKNINVIMFFFCARGFAPISRMPFNLNRQEVYLF